MQFWLELLAQLSTVRSVVSISNWLAVLTPLSADISIKTSQSESTIRYASLTDYARETLKHCIGENCIESVYCYAKADQWYEKMNPNKKQSFFCAINTSFVLRTFFLDTRLEPHLELIVGDVQVFKKFELTHAWRYFFQQVSFHVDTHLSVCNTEREWLKSRKNYAPVCPAVFRMSLIIGKLVDSKPAYGLR